MYLDDDATGTISPTWLKLDGADGGGGGRVRTAGGLEDEETLFPRLQLEAVAEAAMVADGREINPELLVVVRNWPG